MPRHVQTTKVAQTKCDFCRREKATSAPLAERWYWQSDGGDGLFVLCTDCAKNWRYAQR
jgi:hypothetical protein